MGDFTSRVETRKVSFFTRFPSDGQKTAMKARVRALLRTQAAKRVAKRTFQRFWKVCIECKDNGGAATSKEWSQCFAMFCR